MWLAFSRVPMTLGQVAEAVLVGREQQLMDPGDQFRDVHDLLDLCSSFVCLAGAPPLWSLILWKQKGIDKEQFASDAYLVLRLAHSSVKEYILSDGTNIASLHMHRLTSGTAQRFMAEACLICLNRVDGESFTGDEYLRKRQFLIYAVFEWFRHYEEIPAEEEDSVVDLLLTFIDTHHYGYAYRNWLGLLREWYWFGILNGWDWFGLHRDWSITDHQAIAPLAALSSLGAPRAVRALVENAAEAHVTEHSMKKGLTYASRRGHTAVVRVLLDAGARLNCVGVIDASSLSQALSEATRRGLTGVVELLISRGANAKELDYRFISVVAARQGNTYIVKLSLDCTTTKCKKIKIFYGALQAAISARQRSIVECLMERSAEIDITSKDDLYFPTLQMASIRRDDSTARFLISRAFGSEARDIRRVKLEVLGSSCTPRTKLVLLQILGLGIDPPLLGRNHERDYIPARDVYWQSAVEVEYTIKEILLTERKLLEEEELIEEATDPLQQIRSLSAAASSTIETESDGMVE